MHAELNSYTYSNWLAIVDCIGSVIDAINENKSLHLIINKHRSCAISLMNLVINFEELFCVQYLNLCYLTMFLLLLLLIK